MWKKIRVSGLAAFVASLIQIVMLITRVTIIFNIYIIVVTKNNNQM